MKKIHLLKAIIFLAAFLLFQIELIIAKILLPKFGGSYLVWGACVVFFQAALLLGYWYIHALLMRLGVFRYRLFHLILAALPLAVFPGRPLPLLAANPHLPLVLDVSWQLLRSVGFVFFVLSTTSILFQAWLAASELPEHKNPYVLYAVSNLGSFLALLTYPFIFEARFDLNQQILFWRIAYAALVLLHFVNFFAVPVRPQEQEAKNKQVFFGIPWRRESWQWFLLGAASSMLFLSVTNILTYEVAPIPLLWIIPLCIYLASFVLNFKKNPWCPAWIRENIFIFVGFSAILYFIAEKGILAFTFTIALFLFALFVLCMFCQYELQRLRPKDEKSLTAFYLVASLGSFTGGFLVSWVMPLVFVSMLEYLAGVLLLFHAFTFGQKRQRIGWYNLRLVIYAFFILMLWPVAFKGYNVFGLIILVLSFKSIFQELKQNAQAMQVYLLCVVVVAPVIDSLWSRQNFLFEHRNYYGIYKVYQKRGKYLLLHGSTLHGAQYLDPKRAKEALTYYHLKTPVGELLSDPKSNFRRIAAVGLGSGALAVYVKKGQEMDFYEIDPDVYQIATEYFTYLKQAEGKLRFIFGDARLNLLKDTGSPYSLIIVDAFSGDSIPVHLLTVEAMQEYRKRLSPDGIILFHLSNRYLHLTPVVAKNAQTAKAFVCAKSNQASEKEEIYASSWVAVTWDKQAFQQLTGELKWEAPKQRIKARPWTDTYSNVASTFKTAELLSDIKEFMPFYW
jgi:spermidine synthase